MVKILWMPNVEDFLSLVKRSCGDILLQLPDGNQCNLKQDLTAQQMLRTMKLSGDGISLRFSDPHDAPTFLQYMMEAAL